MNNFQINSYQQWCLTFFRVFMVLLIILYATQVIITAIEHLKFSMDRNRFTNIPFYFIFHINFLKCLKLNSIKSLCRKSECPTYMHTLFHHTHQLFVLSFIFSYQYCLFHLYKNECMQIFFHMKILIFTPFFSPQVEYTF